MDRRDDEFALLLGQLRQQLNYNQSIVRVQARGGFVKDQDVRIGDQLDPDRHSLLLPTRNTLLELAVTHKHMGTVTEVKL